MQLPDKAPVLESARLVLRPLSVRHFSEAYLSWMNDAEVGQFLESPKPYTQNMLLEYLAEIEKKAILFWAIHLKEDDRHIGNIKIDPVNARHGLGEYGILLGDRSQWGKGYAMEASERIIQYCFEDLHLRKITLGVVKDNIAAVQLYFKLRFLLEGTYRNHGLYNGRYCDTLRMALFNPEFVYNE